MSFIRRLFAKETQDAGGGAQGVGVATRIYADSIWPDFATVLDAYSHPVIALAVDSIVGSILAPGFYFTSKTPEAAELVTEWGERTGFRGLLFDVIRELVLAGNSFLVPEGRGANLKLRRIPLRFFRPDLDVVVEGTSVRVVNYYLRIQVGTHIREEKLPADQVIHLAWNVVDPSRPWGHGIAHQLLSRQRDMRGRFVPSLLEAEATLRHDLILYLDKAVPRRLISVPGASKDQFEAITAELGKILSEPAGDFLTQNKLEVTDLKAEKLPFEYYSILENMFIAALRSPVVKLFTTPGFTEASAKEAVGVFELYVKGLREYLEHSIEERILPLLTPEKVEIHWGQPTRPELRFADILAASRSDAFNAALISREEARRMLRELGWILEEEGTEALEAFGFGRAKVLDTLSHVEIQFVPPADVDKATIRYQAIDSEKGITLAVAWVRSLRRRAPVALLFDKTLYEWDREKALQYYRDSFPAVLEKLQIA